MTLRSGVPLCVLWLRLNVWLRSALGLWVGVRMVFDSDFSGVPVCDLLRAVRVALRSGVPVCERESLTDSDPDRDNDRSGV